MRPTCDGCPLDDIVLVHAGFNGIYSIYRFVVFVLLLRYAILDWNLLIVENILEQAVEESYSSH